MDKILINLHEVLGRINVDVCIFIFAKYICSSHFFYLSLALSKCHHISLLSPYSSKLHLTFFHCQCWHYKKIELYPSRTKNLNLHCLIKFWFVLYELRFQKIVFLCCRVWGSPTRPLERALSGEIYTGVGMDQICHSVESFVVDGTAEGTHGSVLIRTNWELLTKVAGCVAERLFANDFNRRIGLLFLRSNLR